MVIENFYETNSVKAGRSSYTCKCCGKTINKGEPSDVHKFYPEFNDYRTHPGCSKKFLAGYFCSECGEWGETHTCETCMSEQEVE